MRQRHEHLPHPQPLLLHVVLHDRVLARERVLISQTLVYPLGCVSLLLRNPQVGLEDLVDYPLVLVQLGPAWQPAPLLPWCYRVPEHLAHRVSMQPEQPGRLTDAHPLYVAGPANPTL